MELRSFGAISCCVLFCLTPFPATAEGPLGRDDSRRIDIEAFSNLWIDLPSRQGEAALVIAAEFQDDDAGILIEIAQYARSKRSREFVLDLLDEQTGQSFGRDVNAWMRWNWNRDVDLHPDYSVFKHHFYRRIDPRFAEYFDDHPAATIRLDEILWGGVIRDGIPPLNDPVTIAANEATYLADSDVVFGVKFAGQPRAYPKRILAWHEMVKDHVGGLSINGVYCTLCGSMIVYETEVDGTHHELGTSGFLYRSNKLMYDRATKSLWSTLRGEPVVGPLVGKAIRLQPRHVVTTTWGQWKADHPDTDVLSLQTGHRRDYGEGVAYRDYFSNDRLMFAVPKTDNRLKNKDEVLIIRVGTDEPVAISADFLIEHPVFQDKIGDRPYVVVTDPSGANRVYASDGVSWKKELADHQALSRDGRRWTITEEALTSDDGQQLARLPAHRAFWFGWFADHPNVRLIQ